MDTDTSTTTEPVAADSALPLEREDVTPLPKAKDKAAVDAAAKKQPAKKAPAKRAARGATPKADKGAGKAPASKRAAATKAPEGARRNSLLTTAGKHATTARTAMAARNEAIVAARNDGFVLREISEATGLAHQTVRRICSLAGATEE